jgi:hypothetical protein
MTRHVLFVALAVGLVGCDFNEGNEIPVGGALTVQGDVVDFQSGTPVASSITVSASGLVPPPRITTSGSEFTLLDVPENSVFQILAAAPPSHRPTFSSIVEVTNQDRADLLAPVVSESYLASLATACVVEPTAANGVLFVRLVDDQGAPRAGVTAADLAFTGGPDMEGPCFLDAAMMPDPALTASSSSGYAVYFEVAPGSVEVGIAASATVTVDMAVSPVNAGTVTLAEARVSDGAPMLPVNVSFADDVFPIFTARGCIACHTGAGEGKKLGNLALNAVNPAYDELVLESLTRVNRENPEASLLLTKPLLEVPANHQNATFTSTQDPDYLKILVWIGEGAKKN